MSEHVPLRQLFAANKEAHAEITLAKIRENNVLKAMQAEKDAHAIEHFRKPVRQFLFEAFMAVKVAAHSGRVLPIEYEIPLPRRKWFRRQPDPFMFQGRESLASACHPFNDEWISFQQKCYREGIYAYTHMINKNRKIIFEQRNDD